AIYWPENWQNAIFTASSLIASFISLRRTMLLNSRENSSPVGKAWGSPCSWEMALKILAAWTSLTMQNSGLFATLLAGCAGEGQALEFVKGCEELDLPDPEALLKNPKSLTLPRRSDYAYAVLSSVVGAVLSNNTVERWNAAWKVLAVAVKSN